MVGWLVGWVVATAAATRPPRDGSQRPARHWTLQQMPTAINAGSSEAGGSSSSDSKTMTTKDPLLTMTAGCIAGAFEATATWPLEYIKTQMQTKRKVIVRGPAPGVVSVPQPYKTIVGGIRYTIAETGFFSLYTGLTPTLLLSIPKTGIRFGTNQKLRNLFRADDGTVTKGASFAAGMLAGITEALLGEQQQQQQSNLSTALSADPKRRHRRHRRRRRRHRHRRRAPCQFVHLYSPPSARVSPSRQS